MTFPRIKPYGWQTNEKLLSTQMNQLDIDHSNALDKTGDNSATGGGITGLIGIETGGSITTQGGSMTVSSGDVLYVNAGGAIEASGTGAFISALSGTTLLVSVGAFQVLQGEMNVASTGIAAFFSGSELLMKSGSILDGYGVVNIESGGVVNYLSGSTLNLAGGTFNYELGSLINLNCEFNLQTSGYLNFSSGSGAVFNNGSTVTINSTSSWGVAGIFTFESGSGLGFQSGASVEWASGSSLIVDSGTSLNLNATVNMFSSATAFQPWVGTNTGQEQKVTYTSYMLQSTGTVSYPTVTIGQVPNNKTAYCQIQYVFRDSTNTANSGGGTFNAMMYNKAGSLTGAGSSFYGLVGTASSDDISITAGSGTNFGITVNENSFANNCEWVVNITILYS